MAKTYDAIVVGARVAGSPTAMLLARKGYDVLLVDRASFPSDTISTHLIHPPGITALQRWGLLDKIVASGCPAIDTYAFDFGPFTLSGAPDPDGTVAYGPRRTVLDKVLLDAAVEAGAEVREGFSVESMLQPVQTERNLCERRFRQGVSAIITVGRSSLSCSSSRSFWLP